MSLTNFAGWAMMSGGLSVLGAMPGAVGGTREKGLAAKENRMVNVVDEDERAGSTASPSDLVCSSGHSVGSGRCKKVAL
jgi:hypothetical protein